MIKNNDKKVTTFWRPGMIISVAMFVFFAAMSLLFLLKPDVIGILFTSSNKNATEIMNWIPVLNIKPEEKVKSEIGLTCLSNISKKSSGYAALRSGKLYISEYKPIGKPGLRIKIYQGKNVRAILDPRETPTSATREDIKISGEEARLRYIKEAPREGTITLQNNDYWVLFYATVDSGKLDFKKFIEIIDKNISQCDN